MSEIQNLINEYNEIELQQAARLRSLFDLMKARQGWRFVTFDNGAQWSNCWEQPERLEVVYFEKLTPRIVASEEGTG